MRRGIGWRVAATMAVVFGWLIFVLLYAAFWSGGFSLFQNVVVVLVSFIGGVAMVAAVWMSLVFRRPRRMTTPFPGPGEETGP